MQCLMGPGLSGYQRVGLFSHWIWPNGWPKTVIGSVTSHKHLFCTHSSGTRPLLKANGRLRWLI